MQGENSKLKRDISPTATATEPSSDDASKEDKDGLDSNLTPTLISPREHHDAQRSPDPFIQQSPNIVSSNDIFSTTLTTTATTLSDITEFPVTTDQRIPLQLEKRQYCYSTSN